MLLNYWLILLVLSSAAFISVKARKLTAPAAITGWMVGLLVFAGAKWAGVAMIAAFFVLGTAATSWGMHSKQKHGLEEKDKGRRTPGQVIANAGAAAILALLASAYPERAGLYKVMIAAAMASAAADTLSSELGNMYGRNFYNIITFKKDTRGLNGVISIEGTVIGIAGSAIIAAIYVFYFGFGIQFLLIIIAGSIGNLADSVLGATLERNGCLNNNEVNFLNTVVASLSVLLFNLMF